MTPNSHLFMRLGKQIKSSSYKWTVKILLD